MKDKINKLNKLKDFLICPKCMGKLFYENNLIRCLACKEKYSYDKNAYNFLNDEMITYGNVESTKNVSAHNYDNVALDLINKYPNGVILDNVCGY